MLLIEMRRLSCWTKYYALKIIYMSVSLPLERWPHCLHRWALVRALGWTKGKKRRDSLSLSLPQSLVCRNVQALTHQYVSSKCATNLIAPCSPGPFVQHIYPVTVGSISGRDQRVCVWMLRYPLPRSLRNKRLSVSPSHSVSPCRI